jgi:thiol-disulfide isomerase/thioredoxin
MADERAKEQTSSPRRERMSRVSLQRENALLQHPDVVTSRAFRFVFLITLVATSCFPLVLPPALHAGEPGSAKIHLYYFTSKGCAPCQLVKPAIATLATEGYPVTTIDVGERPDWANSFRVTSTPTVALVRGNEIVGHHAGIVKLGTLKSWFDVAGYRNVGAVADSKVRDRVVEVRPEQQKFVMASANSSSESFSSPTMLKGTRQPRSQAESRAMAATVKLSVEDSEGMSFATGTVIHTHDGESLVMTCGHVFRDSQGKGKVSVEFGFEGGNSQVVPGELISYDSDARDIALVIVANGKYPLTAVPVANRLNNVDRGDMVFSLGCDHGELPTIRHTKIKNRATYDGEIKYDIFGRPVDGRSGGGLFNSVGELVGVCNAAAVEVDEGIYTALDTVHWQLAEVNLSHLFESPTIDRPSLDGPQARVAAIAQQPKLAERQVASNIKPARSNDIWRDAEPRKSDSTRPNLLSSATPESKPAESTLSAINRAQPIPVVANEPKAINRANQIRPVGYQQEVRSDEKEVIILVRSKTNVGDTKTITISEPTKKLLRYLDKMSDSGSQERHLDVARYREIKRPADSRR